ncbi:hypothetical protein PGTUg99_022944 [Puccinia graminis f. sp. tritici]|uniref:Uncharacterized protein n=1 Tax=Puccinia graminis f. sp. tritici TaxID=56615 RepID=A0A5B0MCC2_PUCGR|nr:hypothetical protein PGTUg99_022944 [Puccinia graminis f. sp. tritici]
MSATEDGSEDKAVVLGPVTIVLRSRSLKFSSSTGIVIAATPRLKPNDAAPSVPEN